jgi:hypothetical protein
LNIKRAFWNGVDFGAVAGIVVAAIGLVAGIGPESQTLIFGVSNPSSFAIIMPELFFGTLAGAGICGVLSAAAHVLVHTIPGMRTIMGEPKHTKKPHFSHANYIGRDRSVADEITIDDIRASAQRQNSTTIKAEDVIDVKTNHAETLMKQRAPASGIASSQPNR